MTREEASRGLSLSWVRTYILMKPACEITTRKPIMSPCAPLPTRVSSVSLRDRGGKAGGIVIAYV